MDTLYRVELAYKTNQQRAFPQSSKDVFKSIETLTGNNDEKYYFCRNIYDNCISSVVRKR